MLARVLSAAVIGIDGYQIEVEVDIVKGLPCFATVGLPETAVRESKERVRAAIHNSGYNFPADRITVNLAPADIKKDGTGLDLPIAIGILAADKIIKGSDVGTYMMIGELSLDGRIKPVQGSLPMAITAKENGVSGIFVPRENAGEAAVVEGIKVYAVATLSEVVAVLQGTRNIEPQKMDFASIAGTHTDSHADFSEVKGQEHVKRAFEVAAAGGHNLLMAGPPGSGKTMLAKRLPSILPPMTIAESIETTKIHSVAGMLAKEQALVWQRPFRSPHHTTSDAGLIGGGHIPKPGEVSLAHNGVLFLDELPEFKKHVLEVLRQPIEDQKVTIARAATSLTYPANFMLVAAMNPCPCGNLSHPRHKCICSPNQVLKYRSKVSAPLLDRFDIQVQVPAVAWSDLSSGRSGESSGQIRKRVTAAREIQINRFYATKIHSNSQISSRHLKAFCKINNKSLQLLESAIDTLGLSARAYHRILKIARSIADLENKQQIDIQHITEAISYRSMDRDSVTAQNGYRF